MSEFTHAGGIVFKLVQDRPLFLVLRSNAEVEEWVFPKGHIEATESPETTAYREVEEESGLLTEVVATVGNLEFQSASKPIISRMFLLRYVSEGHAIEQRDCLWLPYEQAIAKLSHNDSRDLLRRASAVLEAHKKKDSRHTNLVLMKQLELLNDRMKETSETANSFLTKYLFGGMIAVIALLNVDLVLLETPAFSSCSSSLWISIVVVLILSGVYFSVVTKHYRDFRESHRKLKYKFELTLHHLLFLQGELPEDYSRRMELSVKRDPDKSKLKYPDSDCDAEILDYLLHHHRKRMGGLAVWHKSIYFRLAMTLVALTITVRLLPLLGQSCPG